MEKDSPYGKRLLSRLILWPLIALAIVIIAAHSFIVHQGTRQSFDERKGVLADVKTVVVFSDEVSDTIDVDLTSSTGLEVRGRIRLPREKRPPHPGVLLFGGIERGKEVVNYPGLEEFFNRGLLISMDYPINPKEHFTATDIPLIRRSAFDAIASITLMVDYLEGRTDVDKNKIVLIGASFGSPFAIVAAGVDERVKAVASLYGGGRLGLIFSHLIEREKPFRDSFWGPAAAYVLGHTGALLLSPLEPTRYVSLISPRPLLMVNGEEDELIPRPAIDALYAKAGEPRMMIWLKSSHIHPTKEQLLQEISLQIIKWLDDQGML